ncbi:MAG TPA: T9SS type A sorting domain-containing protein [Cytophagaceae bacterium]|nr:T9SS type A sorting domain-containing protein [Cytophagaceae bacterium]
MKKLLKPPGWLLLIAFLQCYNLHAQQLIGCGSGQVNNASFSFEYSIGEVYTPTLIASNNSVTSGMLQPFQSELSTGILNSKLSTVSIYPNPVSTILTLSGLDDMKAELISEKGNTIPIQVSNSTIEMSGFQPGIYFLKISNTNQNQTFKIIKQ